jgi:hypothetical protein
VAPGGGGPAHAGFRMACSRDSELRSTTGVPLASSSSHFKGSTFPRLKEPENVGPTEYRQPQAA